MNLEKEGFGSNKTDDLINSLSVFVPYMDVLQLPREVRSNTRPSLEPVYRK